MKTFKVGDIICTPDSGTFLRSWRVVGVFLGGINQEDVVELETLDRIENTQGRMCVPVDLLRFSSDLKFFEEKS